MQDVQELKVNVSHGGGLSPLMRSILLDQAERALRDCELTQAQADQLVELVRSRVRR